MLPTQLDHASIQHVKRLFPVRVICENLRTPENVGMVFRVAEAMGVEKIHLCGTTLCPPNNRILRASRGTVRTVDFAIIEDTAALIHQLRSEGYRLIALEITDNSQDIRAMTFLPTEKIALVVGSEKAGIQAPTLALMDAFAHIPMYGDNSSLNVVAALSIGLFEVVRQMNHWPQEE